MNALAPARSGPGDGAAEWIVCVGHLREVHAGSVRCPITRRAVSLAGCFACHRLVDASDERGRASACATGAELS